MKTMKKSLSLFLVVMMVISIFSVTASAEIVTGTEGKNITWELDKSTGVLTLSGEGPMYDYYFYGSNDIDDNRPWRNTKNPVKKIVINEGITTIGQKAFMSFPNLVEVTIPDSVTSIGKSAFQNCGALGDFIVPDTVKSIGDEFLKNSSVQNLVIGDGVKTLGNNTFFGCNIQDSITIGKNVSSIGNKTFRNCNGTKKIVVDDENQHYSSDENGVLFNKKKTTLIQYPYGNIREHYLIPDSVTTIGDYAFYNCDGISEIILPDSVTTIGACAFQYCDNLGDFKIPDNITVIDDYFLKGSSVQNLVLGNGVKKISVNTFEGCNIQDSITIGKNVSSIAFKAFLTRVKLKFIVDEENQYYSSDENGVLFDKNKTTLIQYPYGNTREHYLIPGSVTTIGDYAFYNCKNIKEITIPDSVTSIGDYAFYNCDGINKVILPDNITSISDGAFYDCDGINEVIIPDNVTSIGYRAFYSCNDLNEIIIPDSVTTIDIAAFYDCKNVKEITIPDSVTTIGNAAFGGCRIVEIILPDSITTISDGLFQYCKALKEITIPDSVTSIGQYAFSYCESLTEIVIPDSVTSIGKYAFSHCESLTEIVIPDSVNRINEFTFYYCDNLKKVTIPDSVTRIGSDAFYHCYKITDVYYYGTEEQFKAISIGGYLSPFAKETIHYNHKHSFNDSVITPPTCTKKGYTTYTCSECGGKYRDDYVDALGHTPVEGVEGIYTAPTCTKKGYTTYTCSECGMEYKDGYVDALGHTPAEAVDENVIPQTCTETGSKDIVVYCSVCDDELSRENITIDATGHDYSTATYVAPPCIQKGYTIYECHCGASAIRDFVDITGHIDSENDGICDQCNKNLNPSTNSPDTDFSDVSDISDIFSIFNIIIELFEKIFSLFGFMKV